MLLNINVTVSNQAMDTSSCPFQVLFSQQCLELQHSHWLLSDFVFCHDVSSFA